MQMLGTIAARRLAVLLSDSPYDVSRWAVYVATRPLSPLLSEFQREDLRDAAPTDSRRKIAAAASRFASYSGLVLRQRGDTTSRLTIHNVPENRTDDKIHSNAPP